MKSGGTTTIIRLIEAEAAIKARMVWIRMGMPARRWYCFGWFRPILVPLPAAGIMTAADGIEEGRAKPLVKKIIKGNRVIGARYCNEV